MSNQLSSYGPDHCLLASLPSIERQFPFDYRGTMIPRYFLSQAFRDIYLGMLLAMMLARHCHGILVERGLHVQESSVGKYEAQQFELSVDYRYDARKKFILYTPLEGRLIVLGQPTDLRIETFTGVNRENRLEAQIMQQTGVVHWKQVERFIRDYNRRNQGREITESTFIAIRNQGAKFYRFAVPLDENSLHGNRLRSGIRVSGRFQRLGCVVAVISARRSRLVEEDDGSRS